MRQMATVALFGALVWVGSSVGPGARGVGPGVTTAVYGGQGTPPAPCATKYSLDPTKLVCNVSKKDTCTGATPANNNCVDVTLNCGYKCPQTLAERAVDPNGTGGVLSPTPPLCVNIAGANGVQPQCVWDGNAKTCICSPDQFVIYGCLPNPKTGEFTACRPPVSKLIDAPASP